MIRSHMKYNVQMMSPIEQNQNKEHKGTKRNYSQFVSCCYLKITDAIKPYK